MGVPGFFHRFVKRRVSKALVRGLPSKAGSLLIDLNGIIHQAAARVYSYGDKYNRETAEQLYFSKDADSKYYPMVFEEVMTDIKRLVSKVDPSSILGIAVDGVVPAAKMSQQRARRYSAALNRAIKNSNYVKAISENKEYKDEVPSIFDSNNITPGTNFMFALDKFLTDWFNNHQSGRRSDLPSTVHYSSHLGQGEGEHKIAEWIRSKSIQSKEPIIVYGSDADLIIILSLTDVDNIYIYREDTTPGREPQTDIISIDAFKNYIEEMLPSKEMKEMISKNPSYRQNLYQDFALLVSFIGNDFLPHYPGFYDIEVAIDFLFKAYQENGTFLTDIEVLRSAESSLYGKHVGKILWDNLFNLLRILYQREEALIKAAAIETAEYKHPQTTFVRSGGAKLDFKQFVIEWHNKILLPITNEGKELVTAYNINVTTDSKYINDLIDNYLDGLQWVLSYYTQGANVISWDWVYKYDHSPLFIDIITRLNNRLNSESTMPLVMSNTQTRIYPIHQLLSVIPPPPLSREIIPEEWVKLVTYPNGIISDMCPMLFEYDYDGKRNDRDAIPLLPKIDINRVETAIKLEISNRIGINPDILESQSVDSNVRTARKNYNTIRNRLFKIYEYPDTRYITYTRSIYPEQTRKDYQRDNRIRGTYPRENYPRGRGRGRGEDYQKQEAQPRETRDGRGSRGGRGIRGGRGRGGRGAGLFSRSTAPLPISSSSLSDSKATSVISATPVISVKTELPVEPIIPEISSGVPVKTEIPAIVTETTRPPPLTQRRRFTPKKDTAIQKSSQTLM